LTPTNSETFSKNRYERASPWAVFCVMMVIHKWLYIHQGFVEKL
jgi:hypothetical protein